MITISERLDSINTNYNSNNNQNKMEITVDVSKNGTFINYNTSLPKSYEFASTSNKSGDKIYDPYDYGKIKNSMSFWGSVFHIYFMSAGVTLLNIPFIFISVGYVNGFLLMFLIIYFYAYNIHTLLSSEYELCKLKGVPNLSYSEIVYQAFKNGPSQIQWFASYGRFISHIVFLCVWFGRGCYGFFLVSQIIQTIYNNLFHQNIEINIFLYIMFLPVYLISMIRKLNYLVPSSLVGSLIHSFIFIVILYYALTDPSSWHFENKFGPMQNIPLFIGTVLFNLNITGIIVPLKNEMKNPKKFNCKYGVLSLSYTLIAFLFSVFSLVCSLRYGTNLRSSVIKNLPSDHFLAQLIPMLAAITMTFQSPLMVYIIVDVIWNNILKETKKKTSHPILWESLLRTAIIVLGFIITYLLPNISIFLSFSGTICTSIDSLIFPATIEILVFWKTNKHNCEFKRVLFKNFLRILLAVILMITGITDCYNEFFSSNTKARST
ncbi:hypothetical protein PGB90_009795 [Kerria lacca]